MGRGSRIWKSNPVGQLVSCITVNMAVSGRRSTGHRGIWTTCLWSGSFTKNSSSGVFGTGDVYEVLRDLQGEHHKTGW